MNILNIQGSSREIDENGNKISFKISDKTSIMKKYGKVITPEVRWYSNPNLFDLLNNVILNNQIDIIVGNSAGGYMAYYLSNYYKIPTFMINPALAITSEAPKIQRIPKNFINAQQFNKQMVILGNSDLRSKGGVDFHLVIDFFSKNGFFNIKTNKMFIEQKMKHYMPLEIFNKYFKKFINYYF